MSVKIKKSKGVVAVTEYAISDVLYDIYEMLGLREAPWIREVDLYDTRMVVFPCEKNC